MRVPAPWFLVLLLAGGCLDGHAASLTIGTTTTTQDTGLMEVLLPAFEADAGIRARAVVGGTGEIIEKGKRGDVDVLLTHSPGREKALVANATGLRRDPVMFNLFVIAGTQNDAAGIRDAPTAAEAFRRIHDGGSTFLSRGDESGTHEKELGIWRSAGLDATAFDHSWYKETGTGQGATLLTAAELDGYMLVDEGTLLQFHQHGKAANLITLYTGDPILRNQYAVTQLRPAAIPAPIKSGEAAQFAEWITGPGGQAVIEAYKTEGRAVFTPNADDSGA